MKVFIITVNIVVIKEMQKDILNDMKMTSINVTQKNSADQIRLSFID